MILISKLTRQYLPVLLGKICLLGNIYPAIFAYFRTCLIRSTLLTYTMVGMVGILNTRNGVKLAGTLGNGKVSVHI